MQALHLVQKTLSLLDFFNAAITTTSHKGQNKYHGHPSGGFKIVIRCSTLAKNEVNKFATSF